MYYPTAYSDDRGLESTMMYNDGKSLTIRIRDVKFMGCEFDSLEPVEKYSENNLKNFTLSAHDFLCNCTIECVIPVIISEGNDGESYGTLEMRLELGKPDERNAIDKEELYLAIIHQGKKYDPKKCVGDFENGLLSLNELLPKPFYIKCCLTCMYSDYSPYGMGLFGSLACFRDVKEQYLELGKDGDVKRELLCFWDQMTEYVQEIHLCEQYKKRIPGTGYRG
jgi:hypothetical protein